MTTTKRFTRLIQFVCTLALLGKAFLTYWKAPPVIIAAEQAAQTSTPVLHQATCSPDGKHANGAFYRICMPAAPTQWNNDLIVFAHGFVPATLPVGIPEDQLYLLGDGTSLIDMVTKQGFAFAVTSYSTNGMTTRDGPADIADLVRIFKLAHPTVKHVYLFGVSQGGFITALALEKYTDLFSGGVAACGMLGGPKA